MTARLVTGLLRIYLGLFWWGPTAAQWLRCCATNRKVAGSITAGVSGFFIDIKSDRTMALESTQPLTEMSTRSISWGKGGRCVRLTTYHHPCAVVTKSGNRNFLEPSGPVQACNGTALPLPLPILVGNVPSCQILTEEENLNPVYVI